MSLSKPTDFGADLLELVRQRDITLHGCKPWYLEITPIGDMKLWFYGTRNRKPWGGGVTIQKRATIDNAILRGDSNMLADAFEQAIDDIKSRLK